MRKMVGKIKRSKTLKQVNMSELQKKIKKDQE